MLVPVSQNPDDAPRLRAALDEAASLPPRERVLLAEPSYYDVTREDNPHTVTPEGELNEVDSDLAQAQWRTLRDAYQRLDIDVEVVDPDPRLPDLVFTANTSWPFLDGEGQPRFVPAQMRHEGRRGEVPVVAEHLESLGYTASPLPEGIAPFEGSGDLQWFGNRRFLFAGTGERTNRKALDAIARQLEVPMAVLELPDPAFFHLDTCLSVLGEERVAYVPEAFTDDGRTLIERLVPEPIEIDVDEARKGLACNLHCPDGQHVLLDESNRRTHEQLEDHGFEVVTIGTSEFRKSGGSVFCMKQMLW